ncbi:MAG: iron-containing alcohol dehydrogenase, partial [Oscillospiraceae bacterium]|nr:iron-containing alcohol dehydrogenase [Oscillospiraceae bacterium]
GVLDDDDVWDFFLQKRSPSAALPIGVVLTIPAAGSETSPNVVITNEETALKNGLAYDSLRPQFAILNPELTYSLPPEQTANGVADMLAHVMERYFSPTQNVDFSDRLCEAAMRSIINLSPKLLDCPTDYDARAEILWAGCVAHGGLLGMGRLGEWSSHRIEHPLSAVYDIAHGAGLAIVFPAWIKYVYRENVPLFVQWAVRVFDVDLSFGDPDAIVLEGVRRQEEFFKRMGLPVRLSEVGIDETDFESMAQKAAPLGTIKKLTAEDIVAIYRLAL